MLFPSRIAVLNLIINLFTPYGEMHGSPRRRPLGAHARPLPQLAVGDRVFVQNQCSPHPNKWDRSGILVELRGNDQVLVKVDGTGRLTLRNRRFLRKYTLPDSFVEHWRGNLFPSVEEKLPVTHGVDSANPVTSHTPTCGLIPEPSSDSMQSGNMQPGMVMNPCSESGEQSAVNPVTQPTTPPEPDDTGVQLVVDNGQSAVQSDPDCSRLQYRWQQRGHCKWTTNSCSVCP